MFKINIVKEMILFFDLGCDDEDFFLLRLNLVFDFLQLGKSLRLSLLDELGLVSELVAL